MGWSVADRPRVRWASIAGYLPSGTGELPLFPSFLAFAVGWVCVGFQEVVVFRGIVERNPIEGLDVEFVSYRTAAVGGWVLSSALFGVPHPDRATSLPAFAVWILAGLVLGLAYLLTDRLAVPIGLHVGVDFGVNTVFGLESAREAGTDVPTIVRPGFAGPKRFVGLSGVVNTIRIGVIGALTVAVIARQYGVDTGDRRIGFE